MKLYVDYAQLLKTLCLEPKYVDVIVRRWEAYTHLEAHLESDGRSFTEVSQERLQLAA